MWARRTEAETFRAALSGRTDAGCGWLRVQLEQPGVLLLRRLGPQRAERVAVAMFGHTGLGMLICRISSVAGPHTYAPLRISLTMATTVAWMSLLGGAE